MQQHTIAFQLPNGTQVYQDTVEASNLFDALAIVRHNRPGCIVWYEDGTFASRAAYQADRDFIEWQQESSNY